MGISDGIEVATIAIGDWIRDWSDDCIAIPFKIDNVSRAINAKKLAKRVLQFRVFVNFA